MIAVLNYFFLIQLLLKMYLFFPVFVPIFVLSNEEYDLLTTNYNRYLDLNQINLVNSTKKINIIPRISNYNLMNY